MSLVSQVPSMTKNLSLDHLNNEKAIFLYYGNSRSRYQKVILFISRFFVVVLGFILLFTLWGFCWLLSWSCLLKLLTLPSQDFLSLVYLTYFYQESRKI